jgi:MerR family transcriptional regulator, light-induced transcriptional regulator
LIAVYSPCMGAPTNAKVDLQTAADELGVHYQTAYRWVRNGRLDAELVGGRYLVSPTDIAELDRARRTPAAPPRPRQNRLEHATDRMYQALVAGDEPAATKIIRRLDEEGATAIELIRVVLVPPLQKIGRAWADGEVTVWVEHRASAIVERLLGDLAPNPRGRRRGVVVIAALTGDHHSLPTTMAALALRADNWHVHHLGADLPPGELTRFCEAHDVDVAVITVTNSETRATADATATRLRTAGTPAIVGGLGNDLTELIDLARRAAVRQSVETTGINTTKHC